MEQFDRLFELMRQGRIDSILFRGGQYVHTGAGCYKQPLQVEIEVSGRDLESGFSRRVQAAPAITIISVALGKLVEEVEVLNPVDPNASSD